ncbi:hypothetical protein SteCoe_38535 [Stentor coeruleus]|uniref:Amidase domain-containing protein n=1 Tax=Stentor coeruleus TaxID=5963 RepID=A0A1R2ALB6_9CILI|nr:hypothetical protein SteCoe_38535 [Stentor coeruleus]
MLKRILRPKKVLFGLLGLLAASYAKKKLSQLSLKRKGQAKLNQRNSKTWQFPFVPENIKQYIISLSASSLAEAIRTGKVSSLQSVSTYCQRAYEYGRDMFLTAEECFADALEEAAKCDEELSRGQIRGILHGVPISIKEHICMKGYTSTGGVVWRLDYPDEETAVVVEILISEGAIPFVRSNVSQSMMWCECSNAIYGRSENPWDRSKTTGGSSGGEGGLIAARLSPLGIGSDIGGSIRIPSAFCGVYSFRVTPQRLCYKAVKTSLEHNIEYLGFVAPESLGPLGRSVDDLILVVRSWFSKKMLNNDETLAPIVFDEAAFSTEKKRKIGYFYSTPLIEAPVAIANAVKRCITELADKYEFVEFQIPNIGEISRLFAIFFNAKGLNYFEESQKGEKPEPYYALLITASKYPYLFNLLFSIIRKIGYTRISDLLEIDHLVTADDYVSKSRRLLELTDIVVKKWEELELDAVICPVVGSVAPPHFKTPEIVHTFMFSSIWNALKFPSGVVPVGVVKKDEAFFEDKFNDPVTWACDRFMKDGCGLPIALQVVSFPYKDEVALSVMKSIEEIFKFDQHPL